MPFVNNLRQFFALLMVLLLLVPPVSAKPKKGEKLFNEGAAFEAKQEMEKALERYEQAFAADPDNISFNMAVRRVRFIAAQKHIDKGQELRGAGKLEESMEEFKRAFAIDPSSTIATQELRRTAQMMDREQKRIAEQAPLKAEEKGLAPAILARRQTEERIGTYQNVPELKPVTRQISALTMKNQPPRVLFETVAKLAGINVVFDPDYLQQVTGRNFSIDLNSSSVEDALDYLCLITKSFWKPLSANTAFITQDNIQKRRDFEDQVVKVFYLQNISTTQELQELSVAVRSAVEARRLFTYNGLNAIIMRGTPDQVGIVEKLIQDLDKPKSEVLVDIYVMEVSRVKTRDLAAAIASSGSTGGLKLPIGFTPRNAALLGTTSSSTGSSGTSGSSGSSGTTTTTSTSISLAKIAKITENDFSITMPGALFQAIMTDRTTKVLQHPQVRTVDGQKGELKIGDRYPYATGSYQPGVASVGVSALVQTQFQFADVGVNVTLLPKVHVNDEVSMHIELDVSSVRDRIDVGGLSQPVIGQRKMTHDVRVKEGEITLIGGLTQRQDTKSMTGTPLLSQIPGFRNIFGSNSTEKDASDLMVALVPHIVRAPEYTEGNMKGIATGTDQVIKLSMNRGGDRSGTAGVPAAAPAPEAPPATVPQTPGPVPPPPAEAKPQPPAAPAVPALTLKAPMPEAQLGTPVTMTVAVENVTDLFSAPLRLKFDPKVLRLEEVSRGGFMGSDGQNVIFTRNIQNDVGEVAVNLNRMPGTVGLNGGGPLITLVFQAIGPGAAKVSVVDAPLKNSKLEPLALPAPEIVVQVK